MGFFLGFVRRNHRNFPFHPSMLFMGISSRIFYLKTPTTNERTLAVSCISSTTGNISIFKSSNCNVHVQCATNFGSSLLSVCWGDNFKVCAVRHHRPGPIPVRDEVQCPTLAWIPLYRTLSGSLQSCCCSRRWLVTRMGGWMDDWLRLATCGWLPGWLRCGEVWSPPKLSCTPFCELVTWLTRFECDELTAWISTLYNSWCGRSWRRHTTTRVEEHYTLGSLLPQTKLEVQ